MKLKDKLELSSESKYLGNFDVRREYTVYKKPKKSGGYRIISIPSNDLRMLQRKILDKIISKEIRTNRFSYGFGKRNVLKYVELHRKSKWVLILDIKKFFDNVHHSRIFNIFLKVTGSNKDATILTRICTLNFSLPQGSPTSPYLANIALEKLDFDISKICISNNLIYSRYFDDICISGSYNFENCIERFKKIIRSNGYGLNEKKNFYGPDEDKHITGIKINSHTSEILPIKITDIEHELNQYLTDPKKLFENSNPEKALLSLLGRIHYCKQVNLQAGSQLLLKFKKIILPEKSTH